MQPKGRCVESRETSPLVELGDASRHRQGALILPIVRVYVNDPKVWRVRAGGIIGTDWNS